MQRSTRRGVFDPVCSQMKPKNGPAAARSREKQNVAELNNWAGDGQRHQRSKKGQKMSQQAKLKILACQISVPDNMQDATDRDAHLCRLVSVLDAALRRSCADLVLLPELSSVSYSRHCFANPDTFAEGIEGPTYEALAPIARRHGCHILYGAPRQREHGKLSIGQFHVDEKGQPAGHFDKLHMAQFGASMEKDYFTPGSHLLVFEIGGLKLAPVICYDMRFAGLADELVRKRQVDVILHSVAFYRDASFYSWHSFVIARALENQIYWLSLNRAGKDFGASILCPPWVDGQSPPTICETTEDLVRFEIDSDRIVRARRDYTFAKDRLETYSALPE